jgi:hypothetical protein
MATLILFARQNITVVWAIVGRTDGQTDGRTRRHIYRFVLLLQSVTETAAGADV